MSLPILQSSTINTTQIRGDVTIDSSVIIASGVILNATEGNKIVLGEGVCVGMGTIITACEGDIYIQENTILGSGSLIFGNCTIGQQVSLGASVTVYNAKIEAMSVIPAGSIIGDRSREVNLKEEININSETKTIIDNVKKGFSQKTKTDNEGVMEENNNSSKDSQNTNEQKFSRKIETEVFNNDVWEEKTPQGNTVVGQVYINKLLFTLFPEKQNKPN